jgi:hypothetical protein
MALSRAERERIADNRMKIRSAADSLSHIDPSKINDFEAIQECLENADKNLTGALESSDGPGKSKSN